jgi:hypothetical protein
MTLVMTTTTAMMMMAPEFRFPSMRNHSWLSAMLFFTDSEVRNCIECTLHREWQWTGEEM